MGMIATPVVALAVALLVWQPWDNGEATLPQANPSTIELTGLLATTDLGVGSNRVSFLLQSPKALVTVPESAVTSLYLPVDGSSPVTTEKATASFHLWPYGTRGNYETNFTFDRPGDWALDVKVQEIDGTLGTARIPLTVKESSITPTIGTLPPLTPNKTLRDVNSIEQLTSWSTPDPELYQLTIAEAIASDRPLMLVFSSPSICTSPTCGPQVDTVNQVKERFKDVANFIHVEVYDNPDEIQGDLGNARYAAAVEAWGLPEIEGYLNESWTFIIGRDGLLSAKYEGFATAEELETGLHQVLQLPPS